MKGALPLTPTVFYNMYKAEFLDEIQKKVLLAIHSHLYSFLLFLQ